MATKGPYVGISQVFSKNIKIWSFDVIQEVCSSEKLLPRLQSKEDYILALIT